MIQRIGFVAAVCLGLTAVPASAGEKKGTPVAEVQKHLDKLKSPQAKVEAVKSKNVAAAFPNVEFVTVHYAMWPVGVAPPQTLKSQNLFAVDKDGKLHHFTDAKGLEKFAQGHLAPTRKVEERHTAAEAWVMLTAAFVQDGFYKFKSPTVLHVKGTEGFVFRAILEVEPDAGNKGSLTATLQFDKAGKLLSVEEDNKVVRGARPRCQATYLLHEDPVIRAICEDSLLVMGRLAESYLMEQRATASPELRREIDRIWKRIVEEGR